ncbi:hypothetical protein [Paenibacillus hamazuiensis]|uniref:ATP-dependent DNA ligase n=1 Tax=Paenibacillus hamazuiensis TaxID=2936508 RepID=UPI00200CF434|nr:hypothetical protein [Paenibacillus hamazuiensis]
MIIAPMMLESAENPFDARDYIFEPKVEGLRVILTRTEIETRLLSHKKYEVTRLFPELHCVPVEGNVILDGVVCRIDPESGFYDGAPVAERMRFSKRKQIEAAVRNCPVIFTVFDVLSYKDRDLRKLPLMKRKSILESILTENEFFQKISYIENERDLVYSAMFNREPEGLIAKRKDSRYVGRRSHDWVHLISPETKAKSILPVVLKNEDEVFDPTA